MKKTLAQRFSAKVKILAGNNACHEWQGCKNNKGYGQIRVAGKTELAHRVAFELANGPIPAGLKIRHTCDNPKCCNSAHLETGTHAQNMDDASKRKRFPNMRKTHCPKGHEYAGYNLIIQKDGGRNCRICNGIRGKVYVARVSPSTISKTHCKRGHERTPANTYTNPAGISCCRVCKSASAQRNK